MWREIGNVFCSLGALIGKDDCRCILLIEKGKSFWSGIDILDPNFDFMNLGNDENSIIDKARKYSSCFPKILEMQSFLPAAEKCFCPHSRESILHSPYNKN